MSEIYIENSRGTILIDDNFRSMTLYGKGFATVAGQAASPLGKTVDINVIGDADLVDRIAIAASSPYFVCLASVYRQSWGAACRLFTNAPSGDEVEYFIYSTHEANPVPDGLVTVRNSEGFVTFNSDAGYLRVRDFVSWEYGATFSRNYRPGRKYATATCSRVVFRAPSPDPAGWGMFATMGCAVFGSTISFGTWNQREIDGGSLNNAVFSGGVSTASAMVIDVTGL